MTSPAPLIELLESALRREFAEAGTARSLQKKSSVKELFPEPEPAPTPAPKRKRTGPAQPAPQSPQPSPVFYILQPRLRLAWHFDPPVDLLIYDEDLGTLGLVHILSPGDIKKVGDWVRNCIDRATYARHLLLTERRLGERLPRSVELVLVFDKEALTPVGTVLREIAREQSTLEAIGINTLYAADLANGFTSSEVRRAFSWLLLRTHRWFRSEAANPHSSSSWKLRALTLNNYRLPGTRRLELADSERLHLVHGHNGSGKSSLVEALELVLTGASERLAHVDAIRYDEVIRYRGSSEPASMILEYGSGPRSRDEFHVTETGPNRTLASLKATSFRLDQTVMDRLARGSDALRAEIFLGAFFPEDSDLDRRLHERRDEARKALDQLPEELKRTIPAPGKEDLPEDPILKRFRAFDPRDATGASPGEDCLPLPLDLLEGLSPFAPGLEEAVRTWKEHPPDLQELPGQLETIDDALGKIRADEILEALRLAKEALQPLSGWYIEGTAPPTKNREQTLNEWLELCALADLGEKQLQVIRSLAQAESAQWTPPPEASTFFGGQSSRWSGEIDAMYKQVEAWIQERNRKRSDLDALPEATLAVASPSTLPRLPTPSQVRALDQAGDWLRSPGQEVQGRFGHLVVSALSPPDGAANEIQLFGNIEIGARDWVQPALERLDQLETICNNFRERRVSSDWMTGGRRLQLLTEVFQKHSVAREAASAVNETLFYRLQRSSPSNPGLYDALNELMALFTPARWAYEDVTFDYENQGGVGRLRIYTGEDKARAELRLNTAELNLLTFSLFLLCAIRVDNPLRLLVLDDPLQNMDELTVTTLARGLAKVLRLLPDPWRLLVLFHGEDDLERFRRELPAAIYTLPWLIPHRSEGAASPPIPVRLGKAKEFQDLRELLADRPSSAD